VEPYRLPSPKHKGQRGNGAQAEIDGGSVVPGSAAYKGNAAATIGEKIGMISLHSIKRCLNTKRCEMAMKVVLQRRRVRAHGLQRRRRCAQIKGCNICGAQFRKRSSGKIPGSIVS
jgi:hypothetical protein